MAAWAVIVLLLVLAAGTHGQLLGGLASAPTSAPSYDHHTSKWQPKHSHSLAFTHWGPKGEDHALAMDIVCRDQSRRIHRSCAQSAVGGIATGGNLGRRKLTSDEPMQIIVGPRFNHIGGGGGARKQVASGGGHGGGGHNLRSCKCPMEFLRSKGLLS